MSALRLFFVSLAVSCLTASGYADLTLSALNGEPHTPLAVNGKKGCVMVFVSPYCPTANSLMPEMCKIAAEFADEFSFYFVHSDKDLKREDAMQHATLFDVKVPVLLDSEQKLAVQMKAKITPEAIVTDPKGVTVYQGRINDLYLGPTRKQRKVTRNDLRDALSALAKGESPPKTQEPAVGCKIGGLAP